MPKYFFHISGDRGLDLDEFGVELPDLDAVLDQAALTIADFARDAAMTGGPMPGRGFEVSDDEGTLVPTVPFGSGGSQRCGRTAIAFK